MKICDNCTGCGACFNICPHKAIVMKANAEGFLYPEVDENLCVHCNLCRKVCPVNHPDYEAALEPECYAAMASDELRRGSSSGAVFPLLAQYVLQNDGYVCGAAFTEDMRAVEHILIANDSELQKLKSSKYLQSNTGKCYTEIKKLLTAGKMVLFTGTPCQVAGLKGYLQKRYDNLFCVDIICHGVPSPKVFQKYQDELGLDGKVISVNFRDKINGWSPYLTTTTTTTTTTYSCPAENDVFMKLFLSNLCLRESCGSCPFNKMPRQGDLTIGDFWRIDHCNPAYNDKKGTSAVLVNTAQGKKLLNQIAANFKLLKKVKLQYALDGNKTLYTSSPIHKGRDIFFKNLDQMSLKENLVRCRQDRVDIAILNFWWSLNYGAILTAYALQQTLKDWGYTSRLVNYVHGWCRKHYNNSFSDKFAERYLKLTKPFENVADLAQLNQMADSFVVGSDQVFRLKYNTGHDFYYYLPFAAFDKKKIACSASFGLSELEGSAGDKLMAKYYLSAFDDISVRETAGVSLCREELGCEAVQIMDPVFWFEQDRWNELIDNAEDKENVDFGLSYVLDSEKETLDIVEVVHKKFGAVKVVDMGNAQKDKDIRLSPEQWLYNIKNCRYLITDSFHGVCFAIIFNKPFVCVANRERGASRFESLFNQLDLASRLLFNDENLAERADVFAAFDYEKINQKLAAEVVRSRNWLNEALKAPKKQQSAEREMMGYLMQQLSVCRSRQRVQEERMNEMGRVVLKSGGLKAYKRKYLRYKLLAALTFGKMRKKYKTKKRDCKQKIRELKKLLRGES